MKVHIRAYCSDIRGSNEGCSFDATLDERGFIQPIPTATGVIMFGSTSWPCVLDEDGEIDFGEASDPKERFWPTNLLKRKIEKDAQFSITGQGKDWVYTITAVIRHEQ